jgi:beta-fructofuranosidase
VLEAHQEYEGSFAFGFPAEILAAHANRRPVSLAPLDGAASEPGQGAVDRYAAWIGDRLPDRCMIELAVDIVQGTHVLGLLLHCGADGEEGATVRLEPQRDRIVFDRWPRGRTGPAQWQVCGEVTHALELERPCSLPPGRHIVQILLDTTSGQVVVDHRVALSFRSYDHRAGHVGLFVTDGTLNLVDRNTPT